MRCALVLFLLTAPGCNGPCWDMDDTNNDGCGPSREPHGVAYSTLALGAAGESFLAVVDKNDYLRSSFETMLVEVDRDGVAIRTDLLDSEVAGITAIAGTAAGSRLLLNAWYTTGLHDANVWWYDNGGLVAEGTIEAADDVVAASDGTYWIAASTKPRALKHYDTQGGELSTIVLGDATSRNSGASLASDPSSGDVVAAWIAWDQGEDRVIIDRVRGGVAESFEIARFATDQAWLSTVAVRDGIAAVLYGPELTTASIAMVSPDGQIHTMPFELPRSCTGHNQIAAPLLAHLVATPSGFAASCEHYVSVADAAGVAYGGEGLLWYPHLATGPGGAIVVHGDEDRALYARSIDTELGPSNTLFVGTFYEVEGCSSSSPSSLGMLILAIGPLFGHRRRRSR